MTSTANTDTANGTANGKLDARLDTKDGIRSVKALCDKPDVHFDELLQIADSDASAWEDWDRPDSSWAICPSASVSARAKAQLALMAQTDGLTQSRILALAIDRLWAEGSLRPSKRSTGRSLRDQLLGR